MTRRTTNLALAGLAVLILAWLVWPMLPSLTPSESETAASEEMLLMSPAPAASVEPTGHDAEPTPSAQALQSYAVALSELSGLPPDAAPGTLVDLWVAWDPPITRRTKIQRLLRAVTIERVVPPVTRTGTPSVLLGLQPRQVSDLIWADRYGTLSATVVSNPSADFETP